MSDETGETGATSYAQLAAKVEAAGLRCSADDGTDIIVIFGRDCDPHEYEFDIDAYTNVRKCSDPISGDIDDCIAAVLATEPKPRRVNGWVKEPQELAGYRAFAASVDPRLLVEWNDDTECAEYSIPMSDKRDFVYMEGNDVFKLRGGGVEYNGQFSDMVHVAAAYFSHRHGKPAPTMPAELAHLRSVNAELVAACKAAKSELWMTFWRSAIQYTSEAKARECADKHPLIIQLRAAIAKHEANRTGANP